MSASKPMRYIAAGITAVAIAFGGYAVGSSNSSDGTNGVANAAQQSAPGQLPRNGQGPPGFGTPVAGAAAQKVKAAVLAKYRGTVESVLRLRDGSYVAHVLTSKGDYRVAVSKDYQVTGAQQGGPRPGGTTPSASS
jgi:hypothetical protein